MEDDGEDKGTAIWPLLWWGRDRDGKGVLCNLGEEWRYGDMYKYRYFMIIRG